MTVKLTALHRQRVIRLTCWLCVKQEQTELSGGCRHDDDSAVVMRAQGCTEVYCTVCVC